MLRVTHHVLAARRKWRFRGRDRPAFALPCADGQESAWDYPRPPRVAPDCRRIRVCSARGPLADSVRALRVLETASPPTFYLPPDDVALDQLTPSARRTFCEWKGWARHYDVDATPNVAWRYTETFPEFAAIRGFVSFYPAAVLCYVDDEAVRPQPGGYYGGWVTSDVAGPFKGEPGSAAWW